VTLQSKVNQHHGKIERGSGRTAKHSTLIRSCGNTNDKSTRGPEALGIPTRAYDWETGWL